MAKIKTSVHVQCTKEEKDLIRTLSEYDRQDMRQWILSRVLVPLERARYDTIKDKNTIKIC